MMRLAFMGFRHGHVLPLYKAAVQDSRIEVVAACEEEPATAELVAGSVRGAYGSRDQSRR